MYGKEICLSGSIKYIDEQHNREKGINSNNFKRSNRKKFRIEIIEQQYQFVFGLANVIFANFMSSI